jgi:CBS domain-containing protein
MRHVSDLLKTKGYDVWSVTPRECVYDALKLMSDKNVGALLVMDDTKLVGIFTERDYARKIVLKGKFSKETPVKDIMSTKVAYVRPEQTIEACMALMTEKRMRHLPVMDDSRVVGIISIGDAVKTIISEQKFEIKQLESYVTGLLHGR